MQKLKGTEDILPQNSYLWQYVEDVARDVFERYHFSEIRTPLIESFDLFSRSVGDTTDIVSKEMYDFYDKGDRHIALRPEGTASVVRAFVENKLFGPEFPKPLKLYYVGPMFRYERPQAGRSRQFHQIGMEVFGSENPATDVEGIALAWDFFNELGLKNLTIHLNSLGTNEERGTYREALIQYFEPHFDQLSEDSKRRLHDNPLRVLDSKDQGDQTLVKNAPMILDYLGEESRKHFEEVQSMLQMLDIPFKVDPSIVRGLDYYQHTIFEIIVNDDTIGAQSTVCGGGRYDGLVEQIGGPSTPGFGFGLGIERLLILLTEQQVELPEDEGVDVFVTVMGEEGNHLAQEIVQYARQHDLIADRDFLGRSMKSQYKTADKYQADIVITIGSNEVEERVVTLKSQQNKQNKQLEVSVDELAKNFFGIYRQLTADTSVIDEFFKGE